MKPNPVIRNSVPRYEEAAEEKEVGENGDDNSVSEHDVRDDAGEKGDEAAAGPEGGEDDEKEKDEAFRATRKADGEECGGGEGGGKEDKGWEANNGVGEDVGRATVGIVGCFSHEDVAFLKEDGECVGASVEHRRHGNGKEAHPFLHESTTLVSI